MKQNGMKTAVTAVGDRYVLEEMRDKGYVIGGEQSDASSSSTQG